MVHRKVISQPSHGISDVARQLIRHGPKKTLIAQITARRTSFRPPRTSA